MKIASRCFAAILAAILMLYPLLVYCGLESLGPGALAFLLLLASVARALFAKQGALQWVGILVAAALCGAVIWTDSIDYLLVYPVLISLLVSFAFLLSLRGPVTLIEKVARLAGQQVPQYAKSYLRKLTLIWGILLLVNAVVAGYTACCMSLQFWALYNGLLSYLLFVGFFVLELGFRQWYKRSIEARVKQ